MSVKSRWCSKCNSPHDRTQECPPAPAPSSLAAPPGSATQIEYWIQEKRSDQWQDYARKDNPEIALRRIKELKTEKPHRRFRRIVRHITKIEKPLSPNARTERPEAI